jgi:tetraacyldisaccharide-1-P 4'-kinase
LNRYSTDGKRLGKGEKIILITGVADASGIVNALNEYSIFHHFEYADHHSFSTNDLTTWQKKYDQSLQSKDIYAPSTNQDERNCVFVCTRKDYMRIMSLCKANSISANFSNLPFYVCHSEIEILFNEKHQLLNKILTRKLND